MNNFLKSLFLISLIVLSYVSCKSPKDATNSHEDPKENTNGLTENSERNTNGSNEIQKEESNSKGIEFYAGTWYTTDNNKNTKVMTIYSDGYVTYSGYESEVEVTNIIRKSDTNFILYYEDIYGNGYGKASAEANVIFLSDTSGTETTTLKIMEKVKEGESVFWETNTIDIVKK